MSAKETAPAPSLPKAWPAEDLTAEQMVSHLLYRDALMLVIDKPAGIAVHRGPKGGESLEDYFGALRFGLTSTRLLCIGSIAILLAAWRSGATTRRSRGLAFKQGKVRKAYWGIVE